MPVGRGAMGKRMLRGWQGTKAGRVEGRGRWTGRIGVERGRWQRGGGDCKGEIGRGAAGRAATGTGRGWQ